MANEHQKTMTEALKEAGYEIEYVPMVKVKKRHLSIADSASSFDYYEYVPVSDFYRKWAVDQQLKQSAKDFENQFKPSKQ